MKKKMFVAAFASTLFLTNACKKKEEEPFSDKFKVTMEWKNLFDNIDNTAVGNSVTVPSGSNVVFLMNTGGEEGFGEVELASIDVVRETASGSETCVFLAEDALSLVNVLEPVYENTKYTFTLKAKDGSTATQGPFDVTVSNDSKVIALNTGLNVYSESTKRFFSTTFRTVSTVHDYDVALQKVGFNPRFIEFGLTKDASNNLYLTSSSLFSSLNVLPEFSAYNCGYRKCKFQVYTGDIDFSNVVSMLDENVLTFDSLETKLNITSTDEKILVQQGTHFMFETEEGKKGIGYFNSVVAGTSAEFRMVYQR